MTEIVSNESLKQGNIIKCFCTRRFCKLKLSGIQSQIASQLLLFSIPLTWFCEPWFNKLWSMDQFWTTNSFCVNNIIETQWQSLLQSWVAATETYKAFKLNNSLSDTLQKIYISTPFQMSENQWRLYLCFTFCRFFYVHDHIIVYPMI